MGAVAEAKKFECSCVGWGLLVRIFRLLIASSVAFAALAGPAAAEMGRSPVPAGLFVSAHGGYFFQDLDGSLGHGIAPVTFVTGTDRALEPEDGWFAGGTLGYVLPAPTLGFDRLELSIDFARAEDDATDVPGPAQFVLLSSANGAFLAGAGTRGSSSLTRESVETSLALKRDLMLGAVSMTVGVVPFVRHSEERAAALVTGVGGSASRNGEVDTWSYGAMLVAEPEIRIANGASLVGHVGAGGYGYDADGDFASFSAAAPIFNTSVSDGASGGGFRGSLGAAIKLKLSDAMTLTAFGKADYWSEVAIARTSSQVVPVIDPAGVRTDDAWEVQAGLRLTLGLAPAAPDAFK